MKITITTYKNNGKEIVSRNYRVTSVDAMKRNLEEIIYDSEQYLQEALEDKISRWAEPAEEDEEVGEHGEHDCLDGTDGTGNIDGTDGRCVVCGKTDLM